MKAHFMNVLSSGAALMVGAYIALHPQAAYAQQASWEYRRDYCVGMARVVQGTMVMMQSGRPSWPQIQNNLAKQVRQAGWPLSQTDFDDALRYGVNGVRSGEDSVAVANFIAVECMQNAWYNR